MRSTLRPGQGQRQAVAVSVAPADLAAFRAALDEKALRIEALGSEGPPALARHARTVVGDVLSMGADARRVSFDAIRRITDAVADVVVGWGRPDAVVEKGAARALVRIARLVRRGASETPERWTEWGRQVRVEAILLLAVLSMPAAQSPNTAAPAPVVSRALGPRAPEPSAPPIALELDLVGLFLAELEAGVPRFQELVLDLEQGSSGTGGEEAMRLAHSLKGAARIVGLTGIVASLHAAEDVLLTAVRGQRLDGGAVRALLRLVDALEELIRVPLAKVPEWVQSRQSLLSEIERAVRTPVAEEGIAAVASPAASQPSAGGDARAVRVSADSITRLLGLAGETVVEARRLSGLSRTSTRLERTHARATARLEDARQRAKESADPTLTILLDGVAKEIAEVGRLFGETRSATTDGVQRLLDVGEKLYVESLRARQRPFAQLVPAIRRQLRDGAAVLGKSAKLVITGAATPIDGDVLSAVEPLVGHLVTNALDHGIEPAATRLSRKKPEHGTITVEVRYARGGILLTIADDGGGVDLERVRQKVIDGRHVDELSARALSAAELREFLFLPGFSTARELSERSGRGVGLDAVRTELTRIGGRVTLESEPGRGTRFELALPVTRVVVRALLVEVAGEAYALPLARAGRVVRVSVSQLHSAQGRDYVELDGENVGVVRADDLLDVGPTRAPQGDEITLVLLGDEGARFGLLVDAALGEDDLVARPLDPRFGRIPDVAATALLADGSPTVVLDADDLLRSIEKLARTRRSAVTRAAPSSAGATSAPVRKRVLVVDDSVTVREVQRQLLTGRGYDVTVAVDGVDGWNVLRAGEFDLAVVDVDMPRMNGLDLVRTIRADSRLSRLPIVIVSYKEREEDRLRGLEVGADRYLAKGSFHDDQLVNVVRDLIGDPE